MKKIFLLGAMVCALGLSVSAQSVPIKQNYLTDRDAENQGKPQLYGTLSLRRHPQCGITGRVHSHLLHCPIPLGEIRQCQSRCPIAATLPQPQTHRGDPQGVFAGMQDAEKVVGGEIINHIEKSRH